MSTENQPHFQVIKVTTNGDITCTMMENWNPVITTADKSIAESTAKHLSESWPDNVYEVRIKNA